MSALEKRDQLKRVKDILLLKISYCQRYFLSRFYLGIKRFSSSLKGKLDHRVHMSCV